jgi:hypothetical protein
MNLRKSIERIEKKIGVGEDWDLLWNRYQEILSCNGVDIESAAESGEYREKYTSTYSAVLKELSQASNNGYNINWMDSVISSCFRREVGAVNFAKLDKTLARIEKAGHCETEDHKLGFDTFRLFREARRRGGYLLREAAMEYFRNEESLMKSDV